MKHCGTQTLETERLLLRRFERGDADAMFRNWACDPEVTKYLTWPAHADTGVSRAVLEDWVASYAREDFYQLAIVCKENGDEPIGSISAVKLDEDLSIVVMDFFFDRVEANRVEAIHDPRNPHSGMVMQKCGMRYEGTLRSSARNNQGICDACWYALLKAER